MWNRLIYMSDPSIDNAFKWACGLLFLAGGLLTAVTRDFGIKQSQIASGWPAVAVGVAMVAFGLALIASGAKALRVRESSKN